jgi:hypothetical protein
MLSSAVRTFSDPDDYAASFREAQVELRSQSAVNSPLNTARSTCIGRVCSGSPMTFRVSPTQP